MSKYGSNYELFISRNWPNLNIVHDSDQFVLSTVSDKHCRLLAYTVSGDKGFACIEDQEGFQTIAHLACIRMD